MPNLSGLPPAADTPTISIDLALPLGTDGVQREKREGAAETAPGASQSSTANLDRDGSTRFAYPCMPVACTAVGANPGLFVVPGFKPGSSSTVQNARYLLNPTTTTTAPMVTFRGRAPAANPAVGAIVNGRRVNLTATYPATVTAGSTFYVTLTFPAASATPRTITVLGIDQFGGAACTSGHALVKPTAGKRRIVIIGDSYTNGASNSASTPPGAGMTETFAWTLALSMGADEIGQVGIGGTGWVVQNTLGSVSRFQGRIADAMSLNPHVVIFAGGRNDEDTGVQTAVELALDTVGSNVERYVMHTCTNTGQPAVIAAMAAAAKSRGVPFLDMDVNSHAKITDGIHMTFDGHQSYAAEARTRLIAAGAMA